MKIEGYNTYPGMEKITSKNDEKFDEAFADWQRDGTYAVLRRMLASQLFTTALAVGCHCPVRVITSYSQLVLTAISSRHLLLSEPS